MVRTHTAWSVPLALFITVLGLLGALYTGTFIGYPLVIGWLLVALALWSKDYPLRRICIMSWHGISSTMLVLQIFFSSVPSPPYGKHPAHCRLLSSTAWKALYLLFSYCLALYYRLPSAISSVAHWEQPVPSDYR
ncbi:hypothetical protein [uncultured Veillonella sp.]|uniref:hypothetical protein n=1 Tax=uncultured Veillonella sp. TaxID=159268 RepID=UPI0025947930|nr:hypothetical protein [uncultured Veillonella sp.]